MTHAFPPRRSSDLFSAAGEKLSDEIELAIERELEAPFTTVASDAIGKASRVTDAAARYVDSCKSVVPTSFDLTGLRIVLDCAHRSEEHTSELQSLMRNSYAVFCLNKKIANS